MLDQVLEIISYFIGSIALMGAYFNSNFRIEGFYLWLISNAYFVLFNIYYEHYGMALMYICYLATTINGISKMKKT